MDRNAIGHGLKLIYTFCAIPIKVLTYFFKIIIKLILKYIWKCKGPRIVRTI